jgi:hypothetical protein
MVGCGPDKTETVVRFHSRRPTTMDVEEAGDSTSVTRRLRWVRSPGHPPFIRLLISTVELLALNQSMKVRFLQEAPFLMPGSSSGLGRLAPPQLGR